MKTITFQREQLYKEVWETPVSKLSEFYGISFSQLKRVCNELNIPTPDSGYWTKVRMGKSVKIKPLPNSEKETFSLIPGSDKQIELHEKLPEGYKTISVSTQLRSLHPLVERTYDYLNDRGKGRNDRLRSHGTNILDVSVTPKHLKRAMRILDAIVKEFERQGYKVQTTSYNQLSKSYVVIDEEEVYFHLHEKGKRVKKENSKYSWDSYDYLNTGELILGLSDSKYWSRTRAITDGKTANLEAKLDKFFISAFDLVEKEKAQKLEYEKIRMEAEKKRKKAAEIAEKKRQIKENRERRFQKELNRRQSLENDSKAFSVSNEIYQFIEAVDREIRKHKLNDIQKSRLKEWKAWATEHAERTNPVEQTIYKILSNEVK
jgi:hypothetical protein